MNKEVLLDEAIINFEIAQLAKELKQKYNSLCRALGSEHPKPRFILVSVLTGASVFSVKLLQALSKAGIDAELSNLTASSYGKNTHSSGKVIINPLFNLEELQDAFVVVAEDVIDLGITLRDIVNLLKESQPLSLHVAAMCRKRGTQTTEINIPKSNLLVGFDVLGSWLEGSGIDTRSLGRGNPSVVAVVNSESEREEVKAYRESLLACYVKLYPNFYTYLVLNDGLNALTQ
jgi:hypoxanthine phosphoribosyltransferase